ncbi:MAG TPA: hypothetical protein VN688_11915 [Gemmataceae bacterium]|nr:hypothetical protein [Gemmataceae bacterium]
MPYKVVILPHAKRQIRSWSLPDSVLVEVYIRLGEHLPKEPRRALTRTRRPFEGMAYYFSMMDPENRLCEHFFTFHILYGQDEETLFVPRGAHVRAFGA